MSTKINKILILVSSTLLLGSCGNDSTSESSSSSEEVIEPVSPDYSDINAFYKSIGKARNFTVQTDIKRGSSLKQYFDYFTNTYAYCDFEGDETGFAYKDGHYYINYDATKSVISAQTEIKVTINSAFYYEGSKPTVFTVTLVPGSTFSPVGTWYMATKYASDGTPTACDKNVVANIKLYEDSAETLSSITYKSVTYKFSFTINENTKKWTFGNKSSTNGSSFGVYMSETDNGYLGIALVEFGMWTGQETGTADTDILGSVVEDEESGDRTVQYQVFVPSSFAK